ncbi:MAG: DUF2752 domain-containing protein [Firmicutes bacterium]|nr:DUF2752 domain-containing protein [Bacillota bacterium]
MMSKKILRIYGIIIMVGLAYWLWIRLTGLQIPCLYLATTGLRCPGCGTTRMLLSLLHLDFPAAFSYNPVVFVLFWIWNLIAFLCAVDVPKFVQTPRFLYTTLGISLFAMLFFGILRNFS